MRSSASKDNFSGFLLAVSVPSTPKRLAGRHRRSISGSNNGSTLVIPEEMMRPSSGRRRAFREENLVPHCSVLSTVESRAPGSAAEVADGMTSESTCAAGGVGARSMNKMEGVHDISLANSRSVTTETGGREVAPSIPSSFSVSEDGVPSVSTSQFLPAVVTRQQFQQAQQHLLSPRSQQLMCEQRQLCSGPSLPYSHQVFHTQRETFIRGEPPQCTLLHCEQPQSQQISQKNEMEEEFLYVKQAQPQHMQHFYQVSQPEGVVAPSFASINRAISSLSQKAAPEFEDDAQAACPFDRLRMLGINNHLRSDISSASRFTAAAAGGHVAYSPDVAQSSSAAKPLQSQGIGVRRRVKEQRNDISADLSVDAGLGEEVFMGSRPVANVVADKKKATCLVGTAPDTAEAVEQGRKASAVRIDNSDAYLTSCLSTTSAPAIPTYRSTVSQLPASEYTDGIQHAENVTRATSSSSSWQPRVIYRGRIQGSAAVSNHLDAADTSTLSSAVEAFMESGEMVSPSLHTSTAASAARAARSYKGSARRGGHLSSSSETPTATLSGSADVSSKEIFARGAMVERRGSLANVPDISLDEKSTHVAASRGRRLANSSSVEESDDGLTGRKENIFNGGTQRKVIGYPVDHAEEDLKRPENLQEGGRKQATQGFGEEEQQQQQMGKEHTKQKQCLETLLVGEKDSQHKEQRNQLYEKTMLSVQQQLNTQEDVRVLRQAKRPACVAFDGRTRSVHLPERCCYGLQEGQTVDTSAACESDASNGKGCMHEESRKQNTQASVNAKHPTAMEEQQSEKESFVCAREYTSSSSGEGGSAESGVCAPLCYTSELADLRMTWQPAMPPVSQTLSCAARTVAPATAARETIESDLRCINPSVAPCGAMDPAAAAAARGEASPTGSRSPLISHPPVRRYPPPRAPGSPCAPDSSLASIIRRVVTLRRQQNSQQQCIAPSLGTPVSEVPTTYATTDRRMFSSYRLTSRLLRLLPSSGGLEKLNSNIHAETTASPTSSPSTTTTTAGHVLLRQSSASEGHGVGNTTESYPSMRLVLPWDRDCSLLPQESRDTPIHDSLEAANEYRRPAAIVASYSTQGVGGAGAVMTSGCRTGFPSYPTCFTESSFRQDLLPAATAMHQTDAAALTWTSPVSSSYDAAMHQTDAAALTWTSPLPSLYSRRRDEVQEELRFHTWFSRPPPVFTSQQQALWAFTRRRHVCGLTEQRERRQLRVVSCIVGAILIIGILYRAIGIIFSRTSSHAVNEEKYCLPHSPQNEYGPPPLWPQWNRPVTGHPYSAGASPEKSSFLNLFNILAPISSEIPRLKEEEEEVAVKWSDMPACAQPPAAAASSAELNNGLTTLSSRVAQFAAAVIVRLSARRRRIPDSWDDCAGSSRGKSAASVNNEKQQHSRQKGRRSGGHKNSWGGGNFTHTRWRRRQSHGPSPVGALLSYIALFIRNLIPIVMTALQILIGYPLLYIFRCLMLLMLRISASFVCTAFVFIFAGRLVLERLKAFRLLCTAVPSSAVGLSSESSSNSNSDNITDADSNLGQYASNAVPASTPRTGGGDDNSETDGPDTSDTSNNSHIPASLMPCNSRSCSRMERSPEVEGNAVTAYSHGLTPPPSAVIAAENFMPFVGSWVTPAALRRVEGLTKLGHLSDLVLKSSLHASKTVAAHFFPLVSVAASAAASFVTSIENRSAQTSNMSEQWIQQEPAVTPERAAHIRRRRESQTLAVQEQRASGLVPD